MFNKAENVHERFLPHTMKTQLFKLRKLDIELIYNED